MDFATVNPATGETVATYPALTDAEVDAAIERSARAFAGYRTTSFAERAAWARVAADVLDAERERVAALMTTEMGKTLAAAAAEADKCARTFRFYAEHAEGFLADEPVDPAEVGAGPGLRPLPAARSGAGGHAVELPAVAGRPLRWRRR